VILDCLGQRCPLPVIALARNIRNIDINDVIVVVADDPAAANDIAAWCRMKGQQLVEADQPRFTVRRLS
jgi:tRNA 2-thiouridine synthesizing protein A